MSPIRRRKLTAREDQILAADKVLKTFKKHKRAQLIMACGTGKTLVSLLISERGRYKSIVIFVPSLRMAIKDARDRLKNEKIEP